jgi:hypothetical protein
MIATNRLVLLLRRCCRPPEFPSNSFSASKRLLHSQGSAAPIQSIANKRSPDQPSSNNEVHEGAVLGVGFNPSGGGIGSGPGGSSSANASPMDAVFATLVGLGIGKLSNFFLSTFY